MAPATGRLARAAAAAALGFACCGAMAQAITANGLGTTASAAGSNWTIGGGTQVGGNLFHSFGRFNINTGGSATFAGQGSVQNIVSRVTGGERSMIDGQLGSSIPGANVWFVNPAGVTFGQNASLNVSGSFHASTANYVRLGDGTVFDAATPASSLTSALPAAFGFTSAAPASILVHGTGSFANPNVLQVAPGRTFSLVGGDVTVDTGSALSAPAGRLNLASVAGAGEVSFGAASIDTSVGQTLGKIR